MFEIINYNDNNSEERKSFIRNKYSNKKFVISIKELLEKHNVQLKIKTLMDQKLDTTGKWAVFDPRLTDKEVCAYSLQWYIYK